MSEILQALEPNAQAQGNAPEALPAVDMRSARLNPEMSGSTDTSNLPTAKVTANHIELGDTASENYVLDSNNVERLNVRDLLSQMLDYPGSKDGVVPDSWGKQQRSEFKRVSPALDSVYALPLNATVESFIDGLREDFNAAMKTKQA